jgi:hypothetical protein
MGRSGTSMSGSAGRARSRRRFGLEISAVVISEGLGRVRIVSPGHFHISVICERRHIDGDAVAVEPRLAGLVAELIVRVRDPPSVVSITSSSASYSVDDDSPLPLLTDGEVTSVCSPIALYA